jgi:hypothetical protein
MDNGKFNFANLLYQFPGFGIVVLDAGKIAADPVLEIFGFPYIYNGIRFIEIAINSWLFRECG